MQPAYLPWLGYLDMVDQADLFVLLDTVAVDRQSWQTRNRVLNRNNRVVWMPVPTNAHMGQILRDVRVSHDKPWRRKHTGTIKALGHQPEIERLLGFYDYGWRYLANFTTALLRELCVLLGITTPIVRE